MKIPSEFQRISFYLIDIISIIYICVCVCVYIYIYIYISSYNLYSYCKSLSMCSYPHIMFENCYCDCSVAKSCLMLFREHTRLPWPSLSPGVWSNACPLSQWCYLTISSSATLFFFCLNHEPNIPGSYAILFFTASDFHHQTHPQLSIISALAQLFHSFWSYS